MSEFLNQNLFSSMDHQRKNFAEQPTLTDYQDMEADENTVHR
jgi:hypothetical protein